MFHGVCNRSKWDGVREGLPRQREALPTQSQGSVLAVGAASPAPGEQLTASSLCSGQPEGGAWRGGDRGGGRDCCRQRLSPRSPVWPRVLCGLTFVLPKLGNMYFLPSVNRTCTYLCLELSC